MKNFVLNKSIFLIQNYILVLKHNKIKTNKIYYFYRAIPVYIA